MAYKDPEKQRQAWREHYSRNKERYVEQRIKTRTELRTEIQQLKEASPCADCGQQYPYWVMDFDHHEGVDKVDDVAKLVNTGRRNKAFAEIAKCDLVCANCHRTRTYIRRSSNGKTVGFGPTNRGSTPRLRA